MSIFEGIAGLFNPGTLIAAGLVAGATIYASNRAAEANERAAEQAAQAAQARAAAEADANRQAQARFDAIQTQTAPAVSHLRDVIATPEGLTPEQVQQREENRRITTENLARSGLRGSGRATVAAFRDIDSDFTNKAIAANRARADTAANQLAGQNFSAATRAAGIDQDTGASRGRAIETGAFNTGQADIANAGLTGQALGDITSILASDLKGRRSRYDQTSSKLRRLLGTDDGYSAQVGTI